MWSAYFFRILATIFSTQVRFLAPLLSWRVPIAPSAQWSSTIPSTLKVMRCGAAKCGTISSTMADWAGAHEARNLQFVFASVHCHSKANTCTSGLSDGS